MTCWHTYENLEVDAVIGDARVVIEIKSREHIDHDDRKGITEFAKEYRAGNQRGLQSCRY